MNREEYDGLSEEGKELYRTSIWEKAGAQLRDSYAKSLAIQSAELLAKEQKEN